MNVVFFDVDGVLLDSLDAHLKVCEYLSEQYNLGLRIPSANEFRSLVRSGVSISPMKQLFMAVGFPPAAASKADEYYRDNFRRLYPLKPFPGAPEMLLRLHQAGTKLGLVTANVRVNVETALGPSWDLFEANCRVTFDTAGWSSKAAALQKCAGELGISPSDVLYVGDQPADYDAASQAGTSFLGVTYGWGITKNEKEFPTVDAPPAIGDYVLVHRKGT